ncbi:MAG: CDP-alcohol phosphatidyltransferase family protein [Anaerolineales bacterium]|nr:CDP-alcohol phosphatidyltransferase family protein [Anaerolineales bacterium]
MANIITLSRFPLLFFYLALLYYGGPQAHLWAVFLILMVLFLDAVDGFVARRRSETSLLGSVLDIATDRTMEYVLWVVFAHLGLISVIVPLIVLIRGTTVDAVRSVGMQEGKAAFDQLSTPLSHYLVSSRFMRALYGAAKTAAFALLTLQLALPSGDDPLTSLVQISASALTWTSVILCLLRGIPVLIEGYSLLRKEPAPTP